jgi:recombination protein RecT
MSEDKKKNTAVSVRFVGEVERQFGQEMGNDIVFSDHQKKLAQHLFLKADSALKEFESKRNGSKTPYTWENVNIKNLALDAVHKVNLGLDALMKNHIHVIPYFNGKNKKYDLDLQTGFKGLLYIAQKYALNPPKKIVIELVHENDHFKPLKSNFQREVEAYEFEVENPFNRGKVIGGFAYIQYEDSSKNELLILTEEDFQKARDAAKTKAIWDAWPEKMRYKTIARRVSDKIDLDPEKVNAQSMIHEETGSVEAEANREIAENANSQTIDIEAEEEEPDAIEEQLDREMDKVEEAIDERQSERKEEQESEKQLGATGTEGPREPSF